MSQTNSKKKLLLLAILCIGIGIGLGWLWLDTLQAVSASEEWPSVAGSIESARLGKQLDSTSSTGKRRYLYSAEIRYRYSVNGVSHSGHRISFGDYSTDSPRDARRLLRHYPRGKSVTVFYAPDNPGEAVLERSSGVGNIVTLLAAIIFLLGGAGILLAFFRALISGR